VLGLCIVGVGVVLVVVVLVSVLIGGHVDSDMANYEFREEL